MRRYLRNRIGRTFFFTLVTDERPPILTTELGRSCLRAAFHRVRASRPFDLTAIVLLPDHLHAVWTMPETDNEYSIRWSAIKSEFTRRWLAHGGKEATPSQSRRAKQERSVWQRRFYEHTCRDDADLKRCIDYVHVNPLKHAWSSGCVNGPGRRSTGTCVLASTHATGGALTSGTETSSGTPSEEVSPP
jgi:putative transposase